MLIVVVFLPFFILKEFVSILPLLRDESDGFALIAFVIIPVIDAANGEFYHLAFGPRPLELRLCIEHVFGNEVARALIVAISDTVELGSLPITNVAGGEEAFVISEINGRHHDVAIFVFGGLNKFLVIGSPLEFFAGTIEVISLNTDVWPLALPEVLICKAGRDEASDSSETDNEFFHCEGVGVGETLTYLMSERNLGSRDVWKAGRYEWDLSKRGLIMGILNVTPDSFSDGGSYSTSEKAISHAEVMIDEGADILDIGGESTRPGAKEVSQVEEIERVIPVIEALRGLPAALSIDTSKPEVAAQAILSGADIVNDVTGFRAPEMIEVCAKSQCGLVAMHMKGVPRTMQHEPEYEDVVSDVALFFDLKLAELSQAGISEERVVFDPGIGFGKTLQHNLSLLKGLKRLCSTGRPLLMGVSRKSLIAALLDDHELANRMAPTVALTAFTRNKGALIHRVHDVAANRESMRMIEALEKGL